MTLEKADEDTLPEEPRCLSHGPDKPFPFDFSPPLDLSNLLLQVFYSQLKQPLIVKLLEAACQLVSLRHLLVLAGILQGFPEGIYDEILLFFPAGKYCSNTVCTDLNP